MLLDGVGRLVHGHDERVEGGELDGGVAQVEGLQEQREERGEGGENHGGGDAAEDV